MKLYVHLLVDKLKLNTPHFMERLWTSDVPEEETST